LLQPWQRSHNPSGTSTFAMVFVVITLANRRQPGSNSTRRHRAPSPVWYHCRE